MKNVFLFLIMVILVSGCSKPNAEDIFNKGVDAQKAEQYDSAIEAYKELIKLYPDSARTPEAYYAIASILQNHKGQYAEAIQTYRQIVEKYPNNATAPSASFLIGFIYNNNLKKIDSARFAYEDFIKKYPNDQLVASAQFELANLGKSPDQILKEKSQSTQKGKPSTKRMKK